MLLLALELTDNPLSFVFLHPVLCCLALNTLWNLKRGRCSILGQLEFCYHLGGCLILWACCFDLQSKLKLIRTQFVNKGIDAERSLVVCLDTIVHDQELSVWRIDSKCFESIKVSGVD